MEKFVATRLKIQLSLMEQTALNEPVKRNMRKLIADINSSFSRNVRNFSNSRSRYMMKT
jgi:hypothetical protein